MATRKPARKSSPRSAPAPKREAAKRAETKPTRPKVAERSKPASRAPTRPAAQRRKGASAAGEAQTAGRSVARPPLDEPAVGARLELLASEKPAIGDLARSSRGKYVYCIIRSSAPLRFGPIGLGAEPAEVYTVIHEDLAAIVSDAPVGVLDPTRDNVLAHQRVNETVMSQHTVLPMSFGTVFKTREDIIELLRSAYDAFGDVLLKMQNKFEFGLKVLWDRDLVIKELEAEDEDLRRLKSEISTQKGSTYFARMQYGRMVDAALQTRSERYVMAIFEALREVAVASRTNKPIGDKMILNAAFLVSRDKEAAFDAKVKQIGQRFEKLTFKYTGPWPPYNFVNIRLKLERA